MNEPGSIRELFSRWSRYWLRNVRWITRCLMAAFLVFLIAQKISPDAAAWVGGFFGLPRPSLAASLGLMALIFLIERVLLLEARFDEPPVRSYNTKVEAYKELTRLVRERGAKRVDLIQFSGQTALPLLREIAESYPAAAVRLLLCHPEAAKSFDKDGHPNHAERVSAAIEQVGVIEEDYSSRGFSVDIRYYRSQASVSTVSIDGEIVSVGWYYYFIDEKTRVLRLRGHSAPALTAMDWHATGLLSFAKRQFDNLLREAEPARADAAPNPSL